MATAVCWLDYCGERRYGMYNDPYATCAEYATHKANGQPVCVVHARRSRLEGKKITPRIPDPPSMAMLPNERHPGPRCSCSECLRRYPDQP